MGNTTKSQSVEDELSPLTTTKTTSLTFANYIDNQSEIDKFPLLVELHCECGISPDIVLPSTLKYLFIDAPIELVEFVLPKCSEVVLPEGLEHLYIWCDNLDLLPTIPESLNHLVCYTQSMHIIKDTSITRPIAYTVRGKSLVVTYRPHSIRHIRTHQQTRKPVLK